MKSLFTALLMLFCMSAHVYADSIIERCVLEEYNGRQSHTPLVGVDVKVKGSNWTTTDVDGYFTLSFRYPPETITDFQFVKDGYVVFNKDAVAPLNVYVDNIKLEVANPDFTGAETERDLAMFSVQNNDYKYRNVNQ